MDFKDIDIHLIEPYKTILTTYGREIIKTWKKSNLFNAFSMLDNLNFHSTIHFETIFNNNFIAYEGRKTNVFYNETQNNFRKPNLLSKTKTKNSIKLSIENLSIYNFS